MRWLLQRPTSVGLVMFCLTALAGVSELAMGIGSTFEVATGIVLLAGAAAYFVLMRGMAGSLDASATSRAELHLRLSQQQAVARLGQRALTNDPIEGLLDEACRVVAAELRADLAGVLELLPDRSEMILRAGVGWAAEEVGVQRVPAGPTSQAGHTLASSRPVIMRDLAGEQRFGPSPIMTRQGITSGITTRIGSHDHPYGVVGAHTYAARRFSSHDVTFLEAVANVLGSSLGRLAAEAQSDKTLRVLETVIEGTTDEIFVQDLAGRYLAVNAKAAETVGMTRAELIGRTLHDVFPREMADTFAESNRQVVERGVAQTFEERVAVGSETRVYLTTKAPYRDRDGTLLGTFGIARDITERKRVEAHQAQLEARLLQSEKLEALGQLAGGVAHDFNNLLVAIRGSCELALGRIERGEDGATGDLEGVLVASERAAGLTKQLLAVGRRQVLDPEVLDLNDVVRENSELLRRVIGDTVTLVTSEGAQPVVVRADRGQLAQVITNLAVNARDAMPRGGVIRIGVEVTGAEAGEQRYALLSVADEGSGIDASTATQIFEPFFTTKGDGGTGLGLATVHGIVAQSGGQVIVDSEIGRGSVFKVFLPLSAESVSATAAKPTPALENGTETILLVEDDPVVRSIVSTMLAARGYEVMDAADGEEAIARFEGRERPIDLVVSDLSMRGLDGRETVGRIRLIEPATKVLFMSGYAYDATIRSGELAPGTSFIQKPFSSSELASRVRDVLDGLAA